MSRVAPYGKWTSPLDLKKLFDRPSPPLYPRYYCGDLYWVEARASEGGRLVLMRRGKNKKTVCVTPAGFNIRTRAQEYGGLCFVLANDSVYFANFDDQRLYRQALDGESEPEALTPARNGDGSLGMYANPRVSPDGHLLVFVYEQEYSDRENVTSIGGLFLTPLILLAEPIVIAAGYDFYADPIIDAQGDRLAWIQWNHPNMPWDASEVAMLTGLQRIVSDDHPPATQMAQLVAGGAQRSVGGVVFGLDQALYFCMDSSTPLDVGDPAANFWNIHRYDGHSVKRVTHDCAEYGVPLWVFGDHRYVMTDENSLVAIRTTPSGDELVSVNVSSGITSIIPTGFTGLSQLSLVEPEFYDEGLSAPVILCNAVSTTVTSKLVQIEVSSGSYSVLQDMESLLAAGDISSAEAIRYPTRDGATAHAYFYPPRNRQFSGPARVRPPLLVMVHGGPTSRCEPSLVFHKQYWTTLGFAVLDINHRGSTGYGRRYRQMLRGHWGEMDTQDVADGVRYLIETERVDGSRVCIRGGSAGGYVVLRALTRFSHLFAAGACYYGIGNLATLARTTHKFEARYLDGLLGEAFNEERAEGHDSIYYQRSPINHLDQLRSPMIVFQGLDDKVVPPALSRELVAKLKEKGVPHEYVEYQGEGHGFRRSETRIDALRRESEFFIRILDQDQ